MYNIISPLPNGINMGVILIRIFNQQIKHLKRFLCNTHGRYTQCKKPLVASMCIQYQIQPFGGHHVVFVVTNKNHQHDSHMVLITKKKIPFQK